MTHHTHRIVWQTYIAPEAPGGRGTFFHNHAHQCTQITRTNLLQPVAENGDDGDDVTSVRIALAAYEHDGMRLALKRLAMCYGLLRETEFLPAWLGNLRCPANLAGIENGRPLAIEPQAIHELPYRTDRVPLAWRGCRHREAPNLFSEYISVLAITVPGADMWHEPEIDMLRILGGLAFSTLTEPSSRILRNRIVADRVSSVLLDWSKFDPRVLRAVFLDLRAYIVGAMTDDELLDIARDMSAHLSLEVLCLVGSRGRIPWLDRLFLGDLDISLLETSPQIVDTQEGRHLNPIALFRGALRPGGRLILIDSTGTAMTVPPFELPIPPVSFAS
ncbi:unnamed protein product [Parascedosporium putredinis]|uniref:Uncharacterized protein n=1 Tax=Parascedosporium putredinis TaxID=1442378 RepID=A0A9P1MAX4_9PEZI|nr:unnamed protein product [Parascedosporium putredinis]CAI7998460.1 unnamed protein product [Parascedosporium putredinis]